MNAGLLIGSVTVIIVGVLLIIFAKGRGDRMRNQRDLTIGVLGALGAGILWGSYFIPIKQSDVSLWIATFPLTIGIFAGSTVLMLLGRQLPRLERRGDYVRVSLSGVLWGIGNYGVLLLINEIGAGRGFTIALKLTTTVYRRHARSPQVVEILAELQLTFSANQVLLI